MIHLIPPRRGPIVVVVWVIVVDRISGSHNDRFFVLFVFSLHQFVLKVLFLFDSRLWFGNRSQLSFTVDAKISSKSFGTKDHAGSVLAFFDGPLGTLCILQ